LIISRGRISTNITRSSRNSAYVVNDYRVDRITQFAAVKEFDFENSVKTETLRTRKGRFGPVNIDVLTKDLFDGR
jgi:hypothetical protein